MDKIIHYVNKDGRVNTFYSITIITYGITMVPDIKELGIDESIISELLQECEKLLTEIALMKELTPHTKDYLISFGERLSTRIFAGYLNNIGVKARQYDAFDLR